MKWIQSIALLAICSTVLAAEDRSFTNVLAELDRAWVVTNYNAMEETLQKALADDLLHPYALAAILHFYVWQKPDYDKANQYADEFLSLIQQRGNKDEVVAAMEIVNEIKRVPRSEYAPLTPEQQAQLRHEFKRFFVHPVALGIVRKLERDKASNKPSEPTR